MIQAVSVFGGSRPGPADYEQALRLGRLLGQAGYSVLTGGYIGTMEAVSRGAAEAGAHVIGVTCEQIEAWRPVRPNAWVIEERRCATLNERLRVLIEDCDAALALPGGPGTLTEIALTWNLLLTDSLPPRPLILIGPGWRATLEQFMLSFDAYIPPEQRRWLTFADSVDEAMQALHSGKISSA
jgi:uncharacterized protein (TIGR00730 family)